MSLLHTGSFHQSSLGETLRLVDMEEAAEGELEFLTVVWPPNQ